MLPGGRVFKKTSYSISNLECPPVNVIIVSFLLEVKFYKFVGSKFSSCSYFGFSSPLEAAWSSPSGPRNNRV